jgi:hypothetical protein
MRRTISERGKDEGKVAAASSYLFRTLSFAWLVCLLATAAGATPLTPEERRGSVRFVESLRNTDGGFRAVPAAGPSSLGATTSGLRALRYLGAKAVAPEETLRFVRNCFDRASGAFADAPGAAVEVRSTAMGLMALAELKVPVARRDEGRAAAAYLVRQARSLPELYIAAAGLDAAKLKTSAAPRWREAWEATRRPDGTYGGGAFDSAGAVVTLLRLGYPPPHRDSTAQALKTAQRSDGGYAGAGEGSDLGATYRVVRALRMLNEKPDLARLRRYVARCRNADGGYGPAPGQPSALSPTYFAAIVLHWADEMER